MKKITFLFFFYCITLVSVAENSKTPIYQFRMTNDIQLTNLELTDTATILTFNVKNATGATLSKGSFIQSSTGGKKYFAKSAVGLPMPMGVKWDVKDKKPVRFSIIFPPIDTTIEKIDFSEPFTQQGDAWQFFGIVLKEHIRTSKLPSSLEGLWRKTDGSNLLYAAFYEESAIYNAQVWQYVSCQSNDNKTEMVLKSKFNSIKLIIDSFVNGNITIFENGKEQMICSLDRIKNKEYKPLDNQPFAENLFKSDTATYCGYIHGFTANMPHFIKLDFDNAITGKPESKQVQIDENGYFETRIGLDYPLMATANFKGIGNERVLLEPGKKTFQSLEYGIPRKSEPFYGTHRCYFMADNAELNDEIHVEIGKRDNADEANKLMNKQTIDQLTETLNIEYNQGLSLLEDYKNERNLSPKAVAILSSNTLMKRTSLLSDFLDYKIKNIIKNNSKNAMSELKFIVKTKIDSIFALSMIESVKQPVIFIDYRFAATFRKIPTNNYFVPMMKIFTENKWNMVGDIAKKCKDLTPEEIAFLDTLASLSKGKNDTITFKKYKTNFVMFFSSHPSELKEYMEEISQKKLLETIKTGFSESIWAADLIRTNIIFKKLDDYKLLTDEQLNETTKQFSNPVIIAKITEANNNLKKKILTQKSKRNFTVCKTPNVTPEKIVETILKKYRGKVVYLDLWATWCGPCLRNIADMKSLKESFKADSVVFVYITNETSPKNLWENLIPDIEGNHYRLTQTEWDVMSKNLNVTSIPHGILYNKTGDIVSPKIQGLTNTDVKNLLNNTLGKKQLKFASTHNSTNGIYMVVDKMPVFPGGETELMRFIASNLHYPVVTQKLGIQGKVIVRFVVNKQGQVENAEVVRSLDSSLDEEAIRVVKSLPGWIPGEHKGQKVSVYYTLPITYKLN